MVQYINKLLKQSFFNLNEKWEEKYPIVIKSWQDNWEKLTEYFIMPGLLFYIHDLIYSILIATYQDQINIPIL